MNKRTNSVVMRKYETRKKLGQTPAMNINNA